MENYHTLKNLKRVNRLLGLMILFFVIYLVVGPLIPNVTFAFYKAFSPNHARAQEAARQATVPFVPSAETNFLVVPSIGVNQQIIETSDIHDVHHKVWHRPNTSTPEKGSRTVLIAHRYSDIGGLAESTFFHLPKMQNGDLAYVYWQGKTYTYEVFETKTVTPETVSVEFPTPGNILTMYTCTPLWTAKNRFVVNARLIKTENGISPDATLK